MGFYLKFPDFRVFSLLRGQVNVAFPASPFSSAASLVTNWVLQQLHHGENQVLFSEHYYWVTRYFGVRFYSQHFLLWEAGASHDDFMAYFRVHDIPAKAEMDTTAGSGLVITSLNLFPWPIGWCACHPFSRNGTLQNWKSKLFTVLPANLGNLVSLGETPLCQAKSWPVPCAVLATLRVS